MRLLKELPAELQSDSVHTLRRYLIGKVNAFHEENFGQQIPSYIHIIKSGDAPHTNDTPHANAQHELM